MIKKEELIAKVAELENKIVDLDKTIDKEIQDYNELFAK